MGAVGVDALDVLGDADALAGVDGDGSCLHDLMAFKGFLPPEAAGDHPQRRVLYRGQHAAYRPRQPRSKTTDL